MAATIVEFITARLDELERFAHELEHSISWQDNIRGSFDSRAANALTDEEATLRDIVATRRIVAMYEEEQRESHRDTLQDVVYELAARWADHPDYQQEWRL
jgi:hypothetical protein